MLGVRGGSVPDRTPPAVPGASATSESGSLSARAAGIRGGKGQSQDEGLLPKGLQGAPGPPAPWQGPVAALGPDTVLVLPRTCVSYDVIVVRLMTSPPLTPDPG
ncbi:uncharacterized protein LOC103525983 isoform X2 [Calypte anna]|uniref:uncharacterized protein LOC103525983 isoform X2 n=1 Tax=Calypte anna TaxID=9244 RepID=UPI0011C37810|nr:uncharacterized protein LOC103525983 isoform X2 [Calypte anna]